MRNLTKLLVLTITLALTLCSCAPSSNPTVTPTVFVTTSSLTAQPTITPTVLPTETPQTGDLIVVTSAADSGPGTFRQALLDAKSGDTITFDPTTFPPDSPKTIYLADGGNNSALPSIAQSNITVDGSNAGVILDGRKIKEEGVSGLEIYSSWNTTIRGLQIVNFSGSGIVLCGGSNNTIGGDRDVGDGPLGQGNLISNNGIGIDLCSGEENATIMGNLIGTDPTGIHDSWGNDSCGICIEDGVHDTVIGPGNIIANNVGIGIQIEGQEAFGNTITRNSIHNNELLGILLKFDGNSKLAAPLIANYDIAMGTIDGSTCSNCLVEIFTDSGGQGEIYEGQTKANSAGIFAFNKGVAFTGFHVTTTATDILGNTSEFSDQTLSTSSPMLQIGNDLPRVALQPKQSGELEDNRIGILANPLWNAQPEVFPDGIIDARYIFEQGDKRFRVAINTIDATNPDIPIKWSEPELSIDPTHDAFITDLADSGIKITYVLSFWDKEYVNGSGVLPIPRFTTESEIQRYLDFVRFIVQHFKDRIEYYEIWNEPGAKNSIQWIKVNDYINLVERVVPVIRQEYPEAKIVVGSVATTFTWDNREYLFSILNSDIMPLVDVVTWHPMYGYTPEFTDTRQYYYEYPSLVETIKRVASAHGFTGEYVSDELMWYTPEYASPGYDMSYSETKSAKYYARGIVMHLGMDVSVSQFNHSPYQLQITHTIRNLCTIMAGAQPSNLPIEIQSSATIVRSYGFSLPDGNKMIAIWNDEPAVDSDPGTSTTLVIPGFADWNATGIDVLNGFEQGLITRNENGDLFISDFLLKDYPIIIRLSK